MKMLDIACGDMAWMSRFLETRDDVEYTGFDIVPDVIAHHKTRYKGRGWVFHNVDILTEPISGVYDLILCRAMLQHLVTNDVRKVLKKISLSQGSYVLVSTFSSQHFNEELDRSISNPGRSRKLNLEIAPFSLTPPLCLTRDGPPSDFEGWEHFMGLWKLPLMQIAGCKTVKEFKLMGTNKLIYSCIEWSPYLDIA